MAYILQLYRMPSVSMAFAAVVRSKAHPHNIFQHRPIDWSSSHMMHLVLQQCSKKSCTRVYQIHLYTVCSKWATSTGWNLGRVSTITLDQVSAILAFRGRAVWRLAICGRIHMVLSNAGKTYSIFKFCYIYGVCTWILSVSTLSTMYAVGANCWRNYDRNFEHLSVGLHWSITRNKCVCFRVCTGCAFERKPHTGNSNFYNNWNPSKK